MIYLDNAATSFPKPEPVYQALDRFARTGLANPGRAGHRMAIGAEQQLDACRHALNQFFRGEGPERWIFTMNCTDGLNLAIKGIVQPGDHVVTTDLEHNSISRPLRALEKAGVIGLTRVASEDGYVDPEAIGRAITPATSMVAMTHASNVLGTVQPIAAIAAIVRSAGALFLLDAAQTAGVVPLDLREIEIDLVAFPGHKALYGPTGTGALYVGPRTDGRLRPWREGGTGGDSSSPTQPTALPYALEGGTPNVLGVAGLAAGVAWVAERGPDALRRHEVRLLQRVVDWAQEAEGWRIAGRWDPETHVGALSLIVPDALPPQDIGAILDTSFDIAVRPGLHCAPYIHRRLGT
jgi:cysteine desulfurase/selenocysteine lyase